MHRIRRPRNSVLVAFFFDNAIFLVRFAPARCGGVWVVRSFSAENAKRACPLHHRYTQHTHVWWGNQSPPTHTHTQYHSFLNIILTTSVSLFEGVQRIFSEIRKQSVLSRIRCFCVLLSFFFLPDEHRIETCDILLCEDNGSGHPPPRVQRQVFPCVYFKFHSSNFALVCVRHVRKFLTYFCEKLGAFGVYQQL